jgi:hypothetical protein
MNELKHAQETIESLRNEYKKTHDALLDQVDINYRLKSDLSTAKAENQLLLEALVKIELCESNISEIAREALEAYQISADSHGEAK